MNLLIGSTFPLSLIRSEVNIVPLSIECLVKVANNAKIHSFWGHENTVNVASTTLGFDLTPEVKRPVILLNDDNLPMFNGIEFKECWVFSPDYSPGFRPEIGKEVSCEQIIGWHVLRVIWK